ncbi:High mobility group protein 20A [Plecturocebus cupreus]
MGHLGALSAEKEASEMCCGWRAVIQGTEASANAQSSSTVVPRGRVLQDLEFLLPPSHGVCDRELSDSDPMPGPGISACAVGGAGQPGGPKGAGLRGAKGKGSTQGQITTSQSTLQGELDSKRSDDSQKLHVQGGPGFKYMWAASSTAAVTEGSRTPSPIPTLTPRHLILAAIDALQCVGNVLYVVTPCTNDERAVYKKKGGWPKGKKRKPPRDLAVPHSNDRPTGFLPRRCSEPRRSLPWHWYVIFLNEQKSQLRATNPDLPFTEVTKMLTARWAQPSQHKGVSHVLCG